MTVSHDDIMDVLQTILDPEMPISIVDLGLVQDIDITSQHEHADVDITILPTFVGCPALPMIQDDIEKKVGAIDAVDHVNVTFVHDPPWSVDRITEAGRESLREHGVTVPESGAAENGRGGVAQLRVQRPHSSGVELRTSAIPCPFCGSSSTHLDSPFGPTRCRMIYYCEACKNSFEHMKRV